MPVDFAWYAFGAQQIKAMPAATKTALPTIHLNGSSRKDLFEGYYSAYRKLKEAAEEFNKVEFNARDYYVQGDAHWSEAQQQRRKHQDAMRETLKYLEEHVIHLLD